MQKWAFVDLETTGGSFDRDRVIEVGIVVMEDGVVTETYSTLVNPERSVPETILGLTGINGADLPTAPLFSEVALHVKELLEGALFVAHNARFDKGFLKAEFARLGIAFNPPSLCTVRLSRRLYPEYRRHNLDELIARFGIECESRHRALDDAQVLVEFIGHVRGRFAAEELEMAIKAVTGERSVPPALDREMVRGLPEKPGVYIFYSEDGFPLYIGKSLNIKERVSSHFSASLSSTKELKIFQGVHHIETRETAGELGALLLESELIKKMQPLYNRKLRRLKRLTVLRRGQNEEGYSTAEVDYLDAPVYDPETVLGMYRSKREAEAFLLTVAKEQGLCKKLLGLENGKGECFSVQLRTCFGACAGREAAELYNQRFEAAFESSRLQTWPHPGPIAIEEKDRETGRGEVFIMHEWKLLGRGQYGEFGLELRKGEGLFDLDQYKILRSYLRNRGRKGRLRDLTPEQVQALLNGSDFS